MEYSNLDTYQITLNATVQAIDPSSRSACGVTVKNMNTSGGNVMYVGPATNRAGSALSATTGYPLAAGESVSLDLTLGRQTVGREFSVIGTNGDKLAVIAILP